MDDIEMQAMLKRSLKAFEWRENEKSTNQQLSNRLNQQHLLAIPIPISIESFKEEAI